MVSLLDRVGLALVEGVGPLVIGIFTYPWAVPFGKVYAVYGRWQCRHAFGKAVYHTWKGACVCHALWEA
jgi:hypothetical protein